jgi:hypothetical protein
MKHKPPEFSTKKLLRDNKFLLLRRKVPPADISAQAQTIIETVITKHNCNGW